MKKYLIIYHREDNDGVVSGALFYDYLTSTLNIDKSEIALLGADYNLLAQFEKDHPIKTLKEEYENIIMTDISFNDGKFMKKIYKEYGDNFIWCDHHKPIIDESFSLGFADALGVRNTSKSAILCVYEYLYDVFNEHYNKKDVPEILRILSAWDSWSYEREGYDFEYVKAINKAYTIQFNLDFEKVYNNIQLIMTNWENSHLDNFDIKGFLEYGNMLNEYDDIVNENIIKTSGDKEWQVAIFDEDKGHSLYIKACAIFHQGATNSTMFKSLKKTNRDIEIGLVFKHSPNRNWVLSMYNINDDYWFHCGEFLKQNYNGGGHKGAAGCTLTQEQFIKILKDRTLYGK